MVLEIIVSAAVLSLPDSSRLQPLSAELDYQFNISDKVSTELRLEGRGNYLVQDLNKDGFADDSRRLDFNLANLWKFDFNSSLKAKAGVDLGSFNSLGGQIVESGVEDPWTSNISRNRIGAFAEGKYAINDLHSIVARMDVSGNRLGSEFGSRTYDLSSSSFAADVKWAIHGDTPDAFGMGLRFSLDNVDEKLWSCSAVLGVNNIESSIAFLRAGYYLFAGYKFTDSFTADSELELREDFGVGFNLAPKITTRWTPWEWFALELYTKASYNRVVPMLQHFGALSTNKLYLNANSAMNHVLEDPLTGGINLDFQLPGNTGLRLSVRSTGWTEKSFVGYGLQTVEFYTLSSINENSPESLPALAIEDRFSAQLTSEPLKWLGLRASGEWNISKIPDSNGAVMDEPMRNIWRAGAGASFKCFGFKLDVDALVNGPVRVWPFMRSIKYMGEALYPDGKTPVWTLLNASLSRDFGPVNVFVGGENLLGTTQSGLLGGAPGSLIISKPAFADFDASQIWAPMVGARVIAGIKVRIK